MILFFAISLSYSLKVYINDKKYSGKTYKDILKDYNKKEKEIISLIVIDGHFPLNSIQWDNYMQLQTLIIPPDSFEGSINCDKLSYMPFLQNVEINEAIEIGARTFANCKKLQKASFNSCLEINYFSFVNCSSLYQIHIPNVIELGSACFENTALTSVILDKLIKTDNFCFSLCTKLETVQFNNLKLLSVGLFY